LSPTTVRWLKILLLVMIAAGVVRGRLWERIPPAWNPWLPLAIDHPLNVVTRWKLDQLKASPEQCLAVLESAPAGAIDYQPLKDYTPVAGCPLSNVVRLRRTGVDFNSPFTVTCPLAVRWLMFERQQLQPLARQHFGEPVSRIDHFGSFACRNVYHQESGRRSEHATASAFDVAAFRLADGRRITVLDDWDSSRAPAKASFLHDVHAAGCDYFGTVLGPDYNLPHANHFHFDTRGYRFCR
jgi:hypothetical protein